MQSCYRKIRKRYDEDKYDEIEDRLRSDRSPDELIQHALSVPGDAQIQLKDAYKYHVVDEFIF